VRTLDAAPRQRREHLRIAEMVIDRDRPRFGIGFGQHPAGVVDHRRHLTAVAGKRRHAAGHRLDQHASELLAPDRRRPARRADDGHRVQPARHLAVRHAGLDMHAPGIRRRERLQLRLERSAADKQRVPRSAHTLERRDQIEQTLLPFEPPEKPDDVRMAGPAQTLADRGAGVRIRPETLDIDAGRDDPHWLGGVPVAVGECLGDAVPERDPARRPPHAGALDGAERPRIVLLQVLKCSEHDFGRLRRRPRDL